MNTTEGSQFTKTCPHCAGKKHFKTLPMHPKGAGHLVNCSKCKGTGNITGRRPRKVKNR